MWLIFLMYLLMASTFTVAKTAVLYMQPLYFIGLRMSIAGIILLLAVYFFKRKALVFYRSDWLLFAQIALFHIYCAYVFEFWGLQYISSAKACLLYNLSPFFTALFSYLLVKHKLSHNQWLGLIVGFCAIIPIFVSHALQESLQNSIMISQGELALLFSVVSSAYGWIVMKKLIVDKGYSSLFVNGLGMLVGGVAALAHAFAVEGTNPFVSAYNPVDTWGMFLLPHLGYYGTMIAMSAACMAFLIIVANIIGYNLYGYLLKTYSPTFLAFAGSVTPLFASFLGWLLLHEVLTFSFFISLGMTILGLYLFYEDEMKPVTL